MTTKTKWLGLTIMGIAFAIAAAVGALVFEGIVTTANAITTISLCVVLGFVGFVLHLFAVVQQWKERRKDDRVD